MRAGNSANTPNLSKIIQQRQRNALTVSNGGLIRLLWNIGGVLNRLLINLNKSERKQEMKKLGEVLSTHYGPLLLQSRIDEMCQFNAALPDFGEVEIPSVFLSWEHIAVSLSFKSGATIPNVLKYAVKHSSDAQSFKKNLLLNNFDFYNKRKNKDLFVNQEHFNIFKSGTTLELEKILAPQRISNFDSSTYLNDALSQIEELIYSFKLSISSWINEQFIYCMWEIGKEINDGYFQIPDDKIKELPKRAYAQLCNDLFRQLPVFSKKAFSNQNVYLASRFAAIFQDIS